VCGVCVYVQGGYILFVWCLCMWMACVCGVCACIHPHVVCECVSTCVMWLCAHVCLQIAFLLCVCLSLCGLCE